MRELEGGAGISSEGELSSACVIVCHVSKALKAYNITFVENHFPACAAYDIFLHKGNKVRTFALLCFYDGAKALTSLPPRGKS